LGFRFWQSVKTILKNALIKVVVVTAVLTSMAVLYYMFMGVSDRLIAGIQAEFGRDEKISTKSLKLLEILTVLRPEKINTQMLDYMRGHSDRREIHDKENNNRKNLWIFCLQNFSANISADIQHADLEDLFKLHVFVTKTPRAISLMPQYISNENEIPAGIYDKSVCQNIFDMLLLENPISERVEIRLGIHHRGLLAQSSNLRFFWRDGVFAVPRIHTYLSNLSFISTTEEVTESNNSHDAAGIYDELRVQILSVKDIFLKDSLIRGFLKSYDHPALLTDALSFYIENAGTFHLSTFISAVERKSPWLDFIANYPDAQMLLTPPGNLRNEFANATRAKLDPYRNIIELQEECFFSCPPNASCVNHCELAYRQRINIFVDKWKMKLGQKDAPGASNYPFVDGHYVKFFGGLTCLDKIQGEKAQTVGCVSLPNNVSVIDDTYSIHESYLLDRVSGIKYPIFKK